MPPKDNNDISQMLKEIIRTLVSVVEHKHEFFKGHSERVAASCVRFANFIAMPRGFIDNIYIAGLLYDIGMVYVPMEIIHKPGKLTKEEMSMIKEHPLIAVKILSHLTYFKDILPMIGHHHEAFNGEGYPAGLKEDAIPIGAKILAIADSYDAMTSERPHRPALNQTDALEQIRINDGKIFDPRLVEEFIKFMTTKPKEEAPPQHKEEQLSGNDVSIHKAVLDIVELYKKGAIELPVFPVVIQKIQEAINSPTSSPDDFAKIIEQDQVITLRIIAVSNSVHYGGAGNVQNVRQAISRVGMKETADIVSAFATKTFYVSDNPMVMGLMEKFWVHATATAYAARLIGKQVGSMDLDIIFLLGLTHDIGKVLLMHALTKILFKKGEKHPDVSADDLTGSIQGIHAGFGGALLKRWGFDDDMIKVVSFHEKPEISGKTLKNTYIIYLANMLTRRIGHSIYTEEEDIAPVAQALKFDMSKIDDILTETSNLVQATTGAA